MRHLKTILSVLLLAAALLVLTVALFWRQLLTPEQKLRYGLTFAAKTDLAARARLHPDDPRRLSEYAAALVNTGNLGRAAYLCELYGAQDERLAGLLELVARGSEAEQAGSVFSYLDDPLVAAEPDTPLGQVFAYLEAYQYALLGDWASAKNGFDKVEARKLAPQLRPYLTYYRARSYRLAGSAEERKQVEKLFNSLLGGSIDPALRAKARYNLIAWYLSDDYAAQSAGAKRSAIYKANDQLFGLALSSDHWAVQKSYTEFGTYYLKSGELPKAWEMALKATAQGIEDPSGKAAGELAASVLEQALTAQPGGPALSANGGLTLTLPEAALLKLARCGAAHGFAPRVAKLFAALKEHVSERARWEELRAGLAICYHAEGDAQALKNLMGEANLRGLSDAAVGAIYYEYALLLKEKGQSREALSYFRSAAKLAGVHAGEANYAVYAVLKDISTPLDLTAAADVLRTVIEKYPDCLSMPKAVEELLPILIYQGNSQAARKLAQWAVERGKQEAAPGAMRQAELEQLAAVGHYWLAYLARKAGDKSAGTTQLSLIGLKYWNYYELARGVPAPDGYSAKPDGLYGEEQAGEFLAGLGLLGEASEFYEGQANPDNPLLLFMQLQDDRTSAALYSNQYSATLLLESGQIAERKLLDFAVQRAYPRPYADEVAKASAATGVSQALIYAVIKKESNFREDAASGVGAEGLMQLMPETVRWLISARGVDIDFSKRLKPANNIRCGAEYLKFLSEKFGGNPRAVIQSYNAGAGNYERWQAQYPGAGPVLLADLVPNEENEGFAKVVWKYMEIYEWLER